MARTAEYDSKHLSTKTRRGKLKPRRKGYFTTIRPALSLGYVRRENAAGSWLRRQEVGRTDSGWPKYETSTIGAADDYGDPDGKTVLSYEQAMRIAGSGELRGIEGPLTVKQAIDRYLDNLMASNGADAASDAKSKLYRHVVPALGNTRIVDLSLDGLRKWRDGLVRHDEENPDVARKSRNTANRTMASFKSSLNRAAEDPKNGITSDAAWRWLETFDGVDARREDAFMPEQVVALIEAAKAEDEHFANLLEGAFFTGARYGELCRLNVRDFDAANRRILVRRNPKNPKSKTKDRLTTLTPEAVAFFKRMAAGKKPSDVLLPRAEGERWGRDQQRKPMQRALAAAGLPATASIYTMRHTAISRARARRQTDPVIAVNLGTSPRMIDTFYGKFDADEVRQMIEETGPVLRVVKNIRDATG